MFSTNNTILPQLFAGAHGAHLVWWAFVLPTRAVLRNAAVKRVGQVAHALVLRAPFGVVSCPRASLPWGAW